MFESDRCCGEATANMNATPNFDSTMGMAGTMNFNMNANAYGACCPMPNVAPTM